jgi:hypothetical protein
MVVGVVGPGVSGPQHGRQRFSRRVAPHPEGEEPEAALVGRGGVLLLGVGVLQGGIKVQHQRFPRRRGSPHLGPGGGNGVRNAREFEGRRCLHRTPGGGNRGHRSEQLGLFTKGSHVGQTVGTVGDGHGQMGEDDARIVGVPVDPARRHGHRHGSGQPAAISQFGQECGARVGHQVLPVDGHPHRLGGATIVHLQGALLVLGNVLCEDSHSPRARRVFRGRGRPRISGPTKFRG